MPARLPSSFNDRHLSLLLEAQKIARIGSWERDLSNNRLWWSDECFRLFGFEPNAVRPTYRLFLRQILLADRQRVREAVADSLVQKTPLDIDFRVHLHGELRVYHMQSHVFADDDGKILRTSGTIQDITERHFSEQRLLLADRIFAHSPIAILVADAGGRILSTNPAFEDITSIPAHEALDRKLTELPLKFHPTEHLRMQDSLQSEGCWAGESTYLRRDGQEIPLWVDITLISEHPGGHHTQELWIFSNIAERKQAEARFNHLAHHDALTGLPNRLSLLARLEQALPEAVRYRWNVALIFLDLDRFKDINDTLGHQTGDQLLAAVAKRLAESVRASDTVARLGGDEFVVILPNAGNMAHISHIASKIIDAFQTPFRIGSHELHTSPSLGIAVFPNDGADSTTLMKNADTAMYHAKASGGNTFQFYAEEMNQEAIARLNLEHKLRRALPRNELFLHFQPQFDAHTLRPCGVEALLRWRTPEDGLISPNQFIPVAEETGLIGSIGKWALEAACMQIQSWRKQGLPDISVAVNVSARQLRQRNFVEQVESAILSSGLPPHLLELEITESVLMEDQKEAANTLEQLRQRGVSLAIDDFGTGYSSLSYLKLLPIHHLKIDRSFVADLEYDLNDRAIAFGTIALAHSLGLKVIAEGVETADQLELLGSNDCDIVQGYLLGLPMPADEAFTFMKQRLQPE